LGEKRRGGRLLTRDERKGGWSEEEGGNPERKGKEIEEREKGEDGKIKKK